MNFALIGAAGFVAPRHMAAINDTGNRLVAALDPHDSVGILDKYSPECKFFTEFERFDRYLEKLRRRGAGVDYVSICSPNYLHDAHCRAALRLGADAICEKPLVLNPWNLDQLSELENDTENKIYVVLQLRLHPTIVSIKENLKNDKIHQVNINYVTPRGYWYHSSWKGKREKSGGLITNIGIHLFDMMLWLFGDVDSYEVMANHHDHACGYIFMDNAVVNWSLSTNSDDLPDENMISYREISIDGTPLRFDNVFTDLHTDVYKDILNGGGFGIEDARPSIELVSKMRGSI